MATWFETRPSKVFENTRVVQRRDPVVSEHISSLAQPQYSFSLPTILSLEDPIW
jgi:hypothetical protein